MDIFLSKKGWKNRFKNQTIIDVAIRTNEILAFCVVEDVPESKATMMLETDFEYRIIRIHLKDQNPNDDVGVAILTGVAFPTLITTPELVPHELLSNSNSDGEIIPTGARNDWTIEFISKLTNRSPIFIRKLVSINGKAYAMNQTRSIFKRVGVNNWITFDDGIEQDVNVVHPGYAKMSTRNQIEILQGWGFHDMAAFSEDDMYAVGGKGDVWHYDGKSWSQCAFPSNEQINTVCCAGDGMVYIGGEACGLWKGRKNTWEKVHKGEATILWNDIRWFNNQLWLSSDYQFKIWNGKELINVEHGGERVYIYGHMDTTDDLLLIASPEYAMLFDGKEWRTIVAPYLK